MKTFPVAWPDVHLFSLEGSLTLLMLFLTPLHCLVLLEDQKPADGGKSGSAFFFEDILTRFGMCNVTCQLSSPNLW